ncbi:MAG: tyrosine phosphatase family-domain-containing protein [Benniella sp.]|nr:MAG: tyrosine phosphatase family-domain-containing protein [Benniella sp.]
MEASGHKRVSSESIQIVTSISDAIVQDDGNITPRAATVITTGVFENGVPLRPVQQDLSILDNNNTHVPLLANQFVITDPGLDSRTNSQATLSNSTSDQQQTQQQQRQRELHYENANAVLVPPLNFAMVAPGVYRSGHPNKNNFPFMRKLGLKVIVQMSEEPYAPDLEEFLQRENIRRIHYKIEGNKEPFIEIDEEVISSALVNILDSRNHPLLIHCAKGKHRIGCLIGCLRKIQNWSMTSIFDEYRRFAGSKVLADQEFIEIFSAKVPYSLEHKPVWL